MHRFTLPLLALFLFIAGAAAQNDIQRGKIKKIDADKSSVTITVDGKDRELSVVEQTRVVGEGDLRGMKGIKEAGFKEGSAVMFKEETRNGKDVLVGMRLAAAGASPANRPAPSKFDTSKLTPLTELATGEYQGFKGGLYPDGKNERPAAHESAGLALAKQVQPLDRDGKPSADGKIVLLSIGMSNTSQSSDGFRRQLAAEKDKNPHVVFVNGAVGGQTAAITQKDDDNGPGTRYWNTVDERLKTAGVTREHVQVVWIKQADAAPTQGFPAYARKLQAEIAHTVQLLPKRFPNVKLAYLSSRTYGGWAKTMLNPEPYAWESGLSVKWLIEQQIKGDPSLNYDSAKGPVKAPWLSWGPYLWAPGAEPRADGFTWEERDTNPNDGTHQSPSGQDKVGKLLLQFFKSDSTTRGWFLRS
jgi:Cu/Ag efflux protein CusF